jgi:four helix bundle protein
MVRLSDELRDDWDVLYNRDMPTIKRFEDLRAWQTAREFTNSVYEFSSRGVFSHDFALRDQIRRSANSVMLNIAEGLDSGSDAEFVRFLGYARRSASETQSALYTALDQKYINNEQFETTYEKSQIAKRQINALISYLTKSKRHSVKEAQAIYGLDFPEAGRDD